jgi:hypothetical protein
MTLWGPVDDSFHIDLVSLFKSILAVLSFLLPEEEKVSSSIPLNAATARSFELFCVCLTHRLKKKEKKLLEPKTCITHTHTRTVHQCICVLLFSFFFIIKVSLITQSESLSLDSLLCASFPCGRQTRTDGTGCVFQPLFIPRSGKHRKSLADVDRDVITTELFVVFIFKAMYLKETGTRNPRRIPLKSHQTIHDIRCTKSAMSFFSPLVAGKHGSYLRLGFRW